MFEESCGVRHMTWRWVPFPPRLENMIKIMLGNLDFMSARTAITWPQVTLSLLKAFKPLSLSTALPLSAEAVDVLGCIVALEQSLMNWKSSKAFLSDAKEFPGNCCQDTLDLSTKLKKMFSISVYMCTNQYFALHSCTRAFQIAFYVINIPLNYRLGKRRR